MPYFTIEIRGITDMLMSTTISFEPQNLKFWNFVILVLQAITSRNILPLDRLS